MNKELEQTQVARDVACAEEKLFVEESGQSSCVCEREKWSRAHDSSWSLLLVCQEFLVHYRLCDE